MRSHQPVILHAIMIAVALATPLPGRAASQPDLALPDGTRLPLPPGTQAFGPDGPVTAPPIPPEAPPPRSATPDERRRRSLDDLYGRLAAAQDATEAAALSDRITSLQQLSGSDTANLLMQRAVSAMTDKDNATALALLDQLVSLQPRWAEAWNKRATVRFLAEDDLGSMSDISHVLALQPRHFGALSGMGMILHRNGDDKAAMVVLKRAAAANPQDEQIKALIEQLRPEVEGTEL